MTNNADMRLLQLLAQTFPNSESASTEIINLEAILSLPKGTEHFVADIHGEHEAFLHILRNASGNIKRKVHDLFDGTLPKDVMHDLCTLIYYPEKRIEMIEESTDEDLSSFYARTLLQLIQVCQSVSSKYTRSKVRKALPKQFAYIIEELLHENPNDEDKDVYVQRIVETIVQIGQARNFIIAICNVIHKLSIDQLHILGDIFDRGPGAHIIMDYLLTRENFDLQWGNHDALWMGAAAGCDACIAIVLRLSLRFANMATLEEGYGINLLPLATFALETYADDPCLQFQPIGSLAEVKGDEKRLRLIAQMHKAISVIQFKLEGQLVKQHPEWNIDRRGTLENINLSQGTYRFDGKDYPLLDTFFPTLDENDPYKLTQEEEELVKRLHHSFRISEKLQKHIRLLFSHGSMYTVCNSNLLYHASVPLNADGSLRQVKIDGKAYQGRDLMQTIEMKMRTAFQHDTPREQRLEARDFFWYLWCGPDSPLFDKSRMTTFERYFLADPATHHEEKGAYYQLREDPAVCTRILDSFGVEGETRHIINGHVPVHASQGENPIKADGMLMVIDGGFAKSYHHTTGIAGYTLVYHSRGFQLIQHEPFTSTQDAVAKGTDIKSSTQIVEMMGRRIRVRDTDKGRQLQEQIKELRQLLHAYRHGLIKENAKK
ncbi:MAG: fructose-1,6-bisphosphatase [Bacteroidaceae bacterium]|nr:fructose-1,6-bisphosphatase [Bacteroidaceae bacterium]MBP5630319.1 fructose-1,6-bisphosphatase [Bacteroidaceae bacterium]